LKVKVIGAGIFGCSIAIELAKVGCDVTLVEKNNDIMSGASKCNHNRIHFGFHYPRSIETAKESLDGLVLFLMRFKDSIVSDFDNYYFVEKNSKVTSKQYLDFCDEVGVHYDFESPSKNIINYDSIDMSLKVLEPVFDYRAIKDKLKSDLLKYKVNVKLNNKFNRNDNYDYIINSSYGNINDVNKELGVSKINVKLQDVIIPIFEKKHKRIGLTIMDGPFCSIMPKGFEDNKFLLYHVEESVGSETTSDTLDRNFDVEKQVDKIYSESKKYYPFLNDIKPIDYWRTLRALPINDNDERLSEIFISEDNPKVISVLSGKVSSCWLSALKIKNIISQGSL
jgi:hypothetical protein